MNTVGMGVQDHDTSDSGCLRSLPASSRLPNSHANNSRIPDSIPLNGVSIETRGGVSSADGGRNGAFSTEAGSGNFVLHADAFDRTADDYATPHGKQDNTSLHTYGDSIGGSFVGSKGFFGIAYSTFDSTYFIPGIEAALSKNHIKLNQERLSSKGEWRVKRIPKSMSSAPGSASAKTSKADLDGAAAKTIGSAYQEPGV